VERIQQLLIGLDAPARRTEERDAPSESPGGKPAASSVVGSYAGTSKDG